MAEKKSYKKYTSFADRFPYIIVALIVVMAIIFFVQLKEEFPLTFFSGSAPSTQEKNADVYPILIASPSSEQIFSFVSKNEYVPIEIVSKEIEGRDYNLNLVLNDTDVLKTFRSPPYRHDWHPDEPGEYIIAASLVDNDDQTISSSSKIKFLVKFEYDEEVVAAAAESVITTDQIEETAEAVLTIAPTISLKVFEGPTYSEGDDICFYRIKATVTGNPVPTVSFKRDDSNGAWGSLKTQINLTRSSPSYTLTASAINSVGQNMDSITLNWDCGPLE